IRERIREALLIETETGSLSRLMKAFREALVTDLNLDDFADMYAQTIAYGLLSARITNSQQVSAESQSFSMPMTNPFLKELMETFLQVGRMADQEGRPGIDFDELGVSDVIELLDSVQM